MNSLKSKLKKQGGFTLVEMLIVVAIIAILIAISIPTVTGALEKSRQATDAANERAAKAEIMIHFLTRDTIDGAAEAADKSNVFTIGGTYVYDAKNGRLAASVTDANGIQPYGQCTKAEGSTKTAHSGCYLWVSVDNEGTVSMAWSKDKTAPTISATNQDLCSNVVSPPTTEVTGG